MKLHLFNPQFFLFFIVLMVFSDISEACPKGQYRDGTFGVCLPKVGGDVAKETDKYLKNLAREIKKSPDAIKECIKYPNRCVTEVLSAPLAFQAQAYIETLYRNSDGRRKRFSSEFIQVVQPYYDVDLSGVTIANNATHTGYSLSYCDVIFFSGTPAFWDSPEDLEHVLHELEHIPQCTKRGKRTYLAEYILRAGMKFIETGNVNIHDMIDYERAADRKAKRIVGDVWKKLKQIEASEGQSGGNGFPPNHVMQNCACIGPNPKIMAPESRCASKFVMAVACNQYCNGFPAFAYVCKSF